VHIQPFDRQYARLGIPALLGGLAMLGTHLLLRDASWPADLLVSGAVGTLVYAAALIGFGLAASERETLRRVAGGISPWRAGSPP
jgi:hypothetical protein